MYDYLTWASPCNPQVDALPDFTFMLSFLQGLWVVFVIKFIKEVQSIYFQSSLLMFLSFPFPKGISPLWLMLSDGMDSTDWLKYHFRINVFPTSSLVVSCIILWKWSLDFFVLWYATVLRSHTCKLQQKGCNADFITLTVWRSNWKRKKRRR